MITFLRRNSYQLLGWGLAALITYYLFKKVAGTRRADLHGICIKAHPYSRTFRSTTFFVGVKYCYKGTLYRGTILSDSKLLIDSCYIKINPNNPEELSASEQCE
jgi:hypothetical protein